MQAKDKGSEWGLISPQISVPLAALTHCAGRSHVGAVPSTVSSSSALQPGPSSSLPLWLTESPSILTQNHSPGGWGPWSEGTGEQGKG